MMKNTLPFKFKTTIASALYAISLPLLWLTPYAHAQTASTGSLQEIKNRGEIIIAVFGDKPPFGYIDNKGLSTGFDVLLGKQIAKDLLGDESKVKFVLVEAQNRVDVLKSNKVDITLANFTVTPERAEQVDFAKPYMKTAIGLVSPKAKSITSLEALQDQSVLINKGTTAELFFVKKYPHIKLTTFDQNTETFNALKDGRGSALAHDNTLLYAWVKENPDYSVSINQIGDNDFIAPAVKKGNTELLNWLNAEIDTLTQARFFHDAYDQSVKPFYGEGINPDHILITQ